MTPWRTRARIAGAATERLMPRVIALASGKTSAHVPVEEIDQFFASGIRSATTLGDSVCRAAF